ncbi:hypothetical protein ACPA9J_09840 [Pseudomonas aeruginosa]
MLQRSAIGNFYDVLFSHTSKDLATKPEDKRRFSFPRGYGSATVMEKRAVQISFPANSHADRRRGRRAPASAGEGPPATDQAASRHHHPRVRRSASFPRSARWPTPPTATIACST